MSWLYDKGYRDGMRATLSALGGATFPEVHTRVLNVSTARRVRWLRLKHPRATIRYVALERRIAKVTA